MAASSDSPQDPETARVIDSEVLAERRARRAEHAEEGLPERAQRAERMVVALERRLDETEGRLLTAERERGALATEVERAERELTAVQQREFAEQRRRIELEGDVGGAVRGLEEESARLRTEHRAAAERAAELTRTLATAHAEVDDARAREQSARQESERTLASRRERVAAEVVVLSQELVRRTSVDDAVAAQLAELRGAVAALRARSEAETVRRTRSDRAAAEVVAGQLRELREEAEGHRAARREAETIVEAVRARAAAFEGELEEERRQRAGLEARLAATSNELHAARARAEGVEGARRILEAELAERMALEQPLRELLGALYEELEEARHESANRAERAAALERLATDLVATAHGLRAGFEREIDALAATHAVQLASEREIFASVLGGTAEHVAGLREQLTTATRQLRVAQDGNPVYDAPSSGPLAPAADHPALARPGGGDAPEAAEPPAVIADLVRAAQRLRSERQDSGPQRVVDVEDPVASEPGVASGLRTDSEPQPAAPTSDPRSRRPPAAAPSEPLSRRPPAVDRVPSPAPLVAPATQPWLAPALAAIAAVDAATAERLLVAALPVQAARVAKDVSYELELPATGRHRVRVRRHRDVDAATGSAAKPGDAEFRLVGPVAALAPLVGGAAPRRLRGVKLRGRRRCLRRLLRAMQAPVGLPELQAAGARPRPGDMLALLCLGVPAEQVRGSDFAVAYVVADGDGGRVRTLVRAEADGSLTAIPEAPELFGADATVTVDADGLLGALAGSAPVSTEGDAQAVATLQRWLRGVQGLPD